MSNPNYSLEIISQHSDFKNKSLRKYYVEGIDTIGAWGDEPFEIKFTNHTWQKVQVKITMDGTDILTGEAATTEPSKSMWVVNGYGTMTLKAWPETNNGGAQFVFTNANNSVAIHTHGDLSCRGIIAAAVYTEGHVEPIKPNPFTIVNEHYYYHPYPYPYYYTFQPIQYNNTYGGTGVGTSTIMGRGSSLKSIQNCGINNVNTYNSSDVIVETSDITRGLESLAAVGAGQHVDQKINYTTGLIKPVLSETVRVRYLWWDDLVSKLKENNVPAPHASGFPADKKQLNINLGKTPRIGNFNKPAFPREQPVAPVYLRV